MSPTSSVRISLIIGMCIGAYLGWEGMVFFFGLCLFSWPGERVEGEATAAVSPALIRTINQPDEDKPASGEGE